MWKGRYRRLAGWWEGEKGGKRRVLGCFREGKEETDKQNPSNASIYIKGGISGEQKCSMICNKVSKGEKVF